MDAFIGQIALLPYTFAPSNWLPCNGQLLSIAQYSPLFALIGTSYGGNGTTTFALPNLNARVPIGIGQGQGLNNVNIGEAAGAETATLNINTMPAHAHMQVGTKTASNANPAGLAPSTTADGAGADVQMYGTTPNANLAPGALTPVGSGAPFKIRNPYLGVQYSICFNGIFPQFS